MPLQQLPQPPVQQLSQPSVQQVLQQASLRALTGAVWLKATAVKARTSERRAIVRFMDISFDVGNAGDEPCHKGSTEPCGSIDGVHVRRGLNPNDPEENVARWWRSAKLDWRAGKNSSAGNGRLRRGCEKRKRWAGFGFGPDSGAGEGLLGTEGTGLLCAARSGARVRNWTISTLRVRHGTSGRAWRVQGTQATCDASQGWLGGEQGNHKGGHELEQFLHLLGKEYRRKWVAEVSQITAAWLALYLAAETEAMSCLNAIRVGPSRPVSSKL
jgi:hypothetical protein